MHHLHSFRPNHLSTCLSHSIYPIISPIYSFTHLCILLQYPLITLKYFPILSTILSTYLSIPFTRPLYPNTNLLFDSAGVKPVISDNAFDDLLGSQGFSSSSSSSSSQPKTIKEMRKEIEKKCMDPEKLKVEYGFWRVGFEVLM